MDAFFSEPVLPLGLNALLTHKASVASVMRMDALHTRFQLEGAAGVTEMLSLPGIVDYAGNRGAWLPSLSEQTQRVGIMYMRRKIKHEKRKRADAVGHLTRTPRTQAEAWHE